MVTGSFVNQAPFAQKLPELLISLFDVQGNLIANRLFTPKEYLLENKNRSYFQARATRSVPPRNCRPGYQCTDLRVRIFLGVNSFPE